MIQRTLDSIAKEISGDPFLKARAAGLQQALDSAEKVNIDSLEIMKPREAASFPAIIDVIRRVRQAFAVWFQVPANRDSLSTDSNTRLGQMMGFCKKINLPVRFLDTEW